MSVSSSIINKVGGDTHEIKIDGATIAANGAYADGDLIGGKIELTDAMRVKGGSGYLVSIILKDKSAQNAELDIVLFGKNPQNTVFTDNSPLDVNDTDLDEILGVFKIETTDYTDFVDNSVATKSVLVDIKAFANTQNLYAAIISRGTPTYAESALSIKLGIERN